MSSNGKIIGQKSEYSSGIWSTKAQQQRKAINDWPNSWSIPPVPSYIGWYTASSLSGTRWLDLSGNGNHAKVTRGTVSVVSTSGNGSSKTFNTLQGGTGDGIRFPTGILPATFTIFHVTRYTGASNQRIFTGIVANWLDGHWSGASGVAYHEGWLTDQTNRHANNWVLSTSQNSLYRSQKVTRGTSGGSASDRISINDGLNSEYSAWQCAEFIVYSGTMSSANYLLVEDYLNIKYGLGL